MNRMHRWLLHLLPAGRRAEHGDEINAVFAQVLQQARQEGRSTIPLWVAEARGLLRYGARERSRPPRMEFRLAWRGLRARGWRAGIAITLLAVAIGANTVMFTVADALLFRPTTYRAASRIVELAVESPGGVGSTTISPRAIDEWRQQTDLFEAVEFYLQKNVFLAGQGVPQLVPTADVSPGMTALLGVTPRWGRALSTHDLTETTTFPVLIGEQLARERFGSPERAVGQTLETTADPLVVVGVMDASFRFPNGTQQIWRVLDVRGSLARGFGGAFPVARLRDNVTPAAALSLLSDRYKAIGGSIIRRGTPRFVLVDDVHRRRIDPSTVWLLLAASICLLATACANVASLELATAITRTRTWAIHRALGASRLALARITAWEGLLILAPALGGALLIAWSGVRAAETWLPERMALAAINTFDIDARAVAFMFTAAVATWIVTTLPTVLYASRRNTVDLLKSESRASSSRLSARLRQGLTAAQVALAVLLLTSGVLAARHYLSVLRIDKGFDSTNVLQVTLTIPPQHADRVRAAEARLIEVLRGVPGVSAVTAAMAPPSNGDSPMPMLVQIDGREAVQLMVQRQWIREGYFDVIGLPMLDGRAFSEREQDSAIVVSDRFARRIGLDRSAVGTRIQLQGDSWKTITGVVRHVPAARELLTGPDDLGFQVYVHRRPPPQPRPGTPPRPRSTGASFAVAWVVVRADSPHRAADVLAAVRASEPGYAVKVASVDDNYASFFSQIRLIRQITVVFGALALLVSMAGIYGVMSYIVAGRRREFGIRVAMGAQRRDIRGLVMRSSMAMVIAGALAGLGGSLAVSRWAGATVFGIRTFEPLIFAAIGTLVTAIALLAVWRPAASAAGSDPVLLLRE